MAFKSLEVPYESFRIKHKLFRKDNFVSQRLAGVTVKLVRRCHYPQ